MTNLRVLRATVDKTELAVRIIEAVLGIPRPPDMTAQEALEYVEDKLENHGWLRAAEAAIDYLAEVS